MNPYRLMQGVSLRRFLKSQPKRKGQKNDREIIASGIRTPLAARRAARATDSGLDSPRCGSGNP
jgi:hypothetical protein